MHNAFLMYGVDSLQDLLQIFKLKKSVFHFFKMRLINMTKDESSLCSQGHFSAIILRKCQDQWLKMVSLGITYIRALKLSRKNLLRKTLNFSLKVLSPWIFIFFIYWIWFCFMYMRIKVSMAVHVMMPQDIEIKNKIFETKQIIFWYTLLLPYYDITQSSHFAHIFTLL